MKPYTDDLDIALIFVRIVISVIFESVAHSLRATTPTTSPIQEHEDKVAQLVAGFTQQVQELATALQRVEQANGQRQQVVQSHLSELAHQFTVHLNRIPLLIQSQVHEQVQFLV